MGDNLHQGADPRLFQFARQNRQAMTDAERVLSWHLRNRKLGSFKFRRQHPIADFIADFFCLEKMLAIELDGNYHNTRDQKEYDEGRTFEFHELQIRVIRFTNQEVLEDIEGVLKKIRIALKD